MLIEGLRQEYNTAGPDGSLGYLPPAPEELACTARAGLDYLEKWTEHPGRLGGERRGRSVDAKVRQDVVAAKR